MRDFLHELAASGHASRFMLEITEEAFLPSGQFQSRILPLIREVGAHISIDDFGSGYSSLATLADITADEVKVDRSLITDIDKRPRNQSLLRAIESIGEALATEVIVEGVETEAEFRYLRDHTRIRVAQGYYFGKPVMLSGVEGGVEWRERASRGSAHRASATAAGAEGLPGAQDDRLAVRRRLGRVEPGLRERREFALPRRALAIEQCSPAPRSQIRSSRAAARGRSRRRAPASIRPK